MSQYDYLVGNTHYDPKDDAVYKCYSISVVEGNVVVYRCKFDSKYQKWGKVNMRDPIHIGDILGYHGNRDNVENVNTKLKEVPTATTKQRGRPKK